MSGNLIDRLGLWTMTHLNVNVRVLRHSLYCEKAPDHDPSQAHGTLDGYAWSVPVAS